MKPKIIKLQLPADLEQKARELAGNRRLHTVIVEALRAQWFPSIVEMTVVATGEATLILEEEKNATSAQYPIIGSIPSEQKR
jgi:hypothetical protein